MKSQNLFFNELYGTVNELIGAEGRTLNDLQELIKVKFPSTFTEYDNMKLDELQNEILQGRGEQENLLKQIMLMKNGQTDEQPKPTSNEESKPINDILAEYGLNLESLMFNCNQEQQ